MKIRKWFFKMRGTLMLPLAIIVLLIGKPTPLSYAIGFAIACIGEAIRIWGVGYAGRTTRSNEIVAPHLVTAGPYAYLRNPLYLGNALTGLGFIVIACGSASFQERVFLSIFYVLSYSLVYGVIIPEEELFLRETFQDTYVEYMKKVPRIVPRLTPYKEKQGNFSWSPVLSGEIQTMVMFILFSVLMLLKMPGLCPFCRISS